MAGKSAAGGGVAGKLAPVGGVAGKLAPAITNTGDTGDYVQGTPVSVHVPADALRVLADRRPRVEDVEVAEAAPVV